MWASNNIIIAIYADDLNIIKTNKEIHGVISYLKTKFEMKDLGEPNTVLDYIFNIFKVGYVCISQTTPERL